MPVDSENIERDLREQLVQISSKSEEIKSQSDFLKFLREL